MPCWWLVVDTSKIHENEKLERKNFKKKRDVPQLVKLTKKCALMDNTMNEKQTKK